MIKLIFKNYLIKIEIILLSFFVISTTSFADTSFNTKTDKITWEISALKATHTQKKNLYIAEGDVIITGGTIKLKADYVEFNNSTKDTIASGNVILISKNDTVSCDLITLNLETQTGTIHNGTIFIQKTHFYIKGNKINKTGKDTYIADKASITSCNGENPDWKITGKDIKVTVEGYGFAKHATLWIKKIPSFYTPFLAFPVKTKIQTGFLTPRISNSNRKGFEYEQPLFFDLSKNTNATIYIDYMRKRGTKLGVEYNYLLGKGANKSKGTIFYNFLDDSKIDDNTLNTSDYSFSTTPQRTNSDRYWFIMKQNTKFANTWNSKIYIDIVSDADYLHEFQKGNIGFNNIKKHFKDNFGTSIDDYDDTIRTNKVNINKKGLNYSLNMDLNWYDNVIARKADTNDHTLQNLPSIKLNMPKQVIKKFKRDLGLYFDFDSEYKYFYRQDTTDSLTNGHRIDIYPKIYLPLNFKNLLFEPSIGIRQTFWHGKEFNNSFTNKNEFHHREIYDFQTEISSKISKIFNTNSKFAEKIKHEIIPNIKYTYIPNVNQDDLPLFDFTDNNINKNSFNLLDSIDRINKENLITWSLINRFTKKNERINIKKNENSENKNYIYEEFAWIKISQSFDVSKHRKDISEHFSDISLESEFSPFKFISFNADVKWSPYNRDLVAHDTGITLQNNRNDSINITHKYQQNLSESFFTRLNANLTNNFSAFFLYDYDLFNEERIETATGFELQKSCWSLSMAFTEKPDDKSFTFLINFEGF